MMIGDEHVAFFDRHGYLQLDQLVEPEELPQIRDIYDKLFDSRAGWEAGDQYDLAGSDDADKQERLPQLMNPAKYAPQLAQLNFRRRAMDAARQILGDSVEASDEHAILKPARDGAATNWHQDEAYWDPAFQHNGISIWIPLQEATLENGCLQFVPGSHKRDIVPHQSIGGDVKVHGLETVEPVDANAAVACPIPAGGCTIHHCRTLHYAGPNRSDVPRRAYILTFHTPPVPANALRRFPWLEARRTARQARAAKT